MQNYDRDDRDKRRPDQSGDDDSSRPPGFRPPVAGGRFVWIMFFGLLILALFFFMSHLNKAKQHNIKLDEFYKSLKAGDIKEVKITNNEVTGEYVKPKDGKEFFALPILDAEVEKISDALRNYNKTERGENPEVVYQMDRGNEFIQFLLIQLLPILLILFIIWFFLARQFRSAGGTGSVLSFGKARARLHSKEKSDVTFDQVAGIDEAKEEVEELVEFLKNPGKFRQLGGRIPRGVLLVGPPGCGKTLLARAIAGEADVPFFSISGSDFIEMFVGVGASRVRDLFRQAKENSPCIIFLDEIDAVGRRRAVDLHGASAESAQTLNAILVEMDGFDTDDNIIVIAATNRPDVLDPALRRPGRFDRQVDVELPDIRGREAILRVHAKKYKLAADVDLRQLARGTPGFSGADLEAVLNEAALAATRKLKKSVGMIDLEDARDKVRWGRQKRSRVMTEETRKTTAYHESGHALASRLLTESQPLHKVSIIPQGRALGMTMSLPEQDQYFVRKNEMLDELCLLLSGRVAEEMFCDDIGSGAQNDLDRATDIARTMVCRWGMSEKLGPISFHEYDEPAYTPHEGLRSRPFSEATALKVDEEVSRLVREAHERARGLLREHRKELECLAQALLKYEVIYASEIDDVLAGKELKRAEAEAEAAEKKPESKATDADASDDRTEPTETESPAS